jgi:ribosome-binding factor A
MRFSSQKWLKKCVDIAVSHFAACLQHQYPMRHKPKTADRTLKVGDQIQRDLAQLLQFEVKDPRIGFITLTGVEVTPDYSHAKVFFSSLVDVDPSVKSRDDKINEILEGLNAAKGFLRREVGRRLSIHQTPELHFEYDDSVARGAAMSLLIDTAVKDKSKDEPSA